MGEVAWSEKERKGSLDYARDDNGGLGMTMGGSG